MPDITQQRIALETGAIRGDYWIATADMAADGILRLHDELISVGGVPVEGSLGGKLILDDALAKCAPGGTVTLEVYRDDDATPPPPSPLAANVAPVAAETDDERRRLGQQRMKRCL